MAEVYTQVERGADKYPAGLIKLLLSRIKECQDVSTQLMKKLSHLTARTEPIYEQLVSIRRQITAAGSRPKVEHEPPLHINRMVAYSCLIVCPSRTC